MDEQGAHTFWTDVINALAQRRARSELNARDKAIAATAACYNAGFYLDRSNNEDIPYTSDLTHAGYYAEIALAMGRASSMVLHVAQRYHRILAVAEQIVDEDVRPKFKADCEAGAIVGSA